MSLLYIDGNDLVRSIKAGAIKLEHHRDKVDMLNVFPVPDGDTGTNMFLTLQSAVREGEAKQDAHLGKVAKAISMGSLMGARGNSGVILSQIFRGFARTLEAKEKANAQDLALALQTGARTAYEAVMKPVEGTILTVARDLATGCEAEARTNSDIVKVLLAGIRSGYATLEKTPAMLPILKEAGVVDAGGQGFLYFIEGLLEGVGLEKDLLFQGYQEKSPKAEQTRQYREPVQLTYQYCTETLVKGEDLKVEEIQKELMDRGDSMLVVGGGDLVKVHIHTNHPGQVLEVCLTHGDLIDIKVNNMQEEVHEHRNDWEAAAEEQNPEKPEVDQLRDIGLVAVGSGDGVVSILQSLGVNQVVEGGQTMNPSTEDLLNACKAVNAAAVILLPNNSNIILAAQQVSQLCQEQKILVVPTKSVMQCITALIAYDPEGDIEEVAAAMEDEIGHVKYAEVTRAVRDSAVNGLTIKEGDVIGLIGDKIEVSGESVSNVVEEVLKCMTNDDSELITLFYGQDVEEETALSIKDKLVAAYPDCEIEVHYGGQPHYSYFISVE